MGAVRSLNGLVLTRIGVGIFEAPCFPANSRILATWFPQQERARANSIYSFGQYVGLGFLSVPLFKEKPVLLRQALLSLRTPLKPVALKPVALS